MQKQNKTKNNFVVVVVVEKLVSLSSNKLIKKKVTFVVVFCSKLIFANRKQYCFCCYKRYNFHDDYG